MFSERRFSSCTPIFDLTVLKDRNLAVACVILVCTGFGVWGNNLLITLKAYVSTYWLIAASFIALMPLLLSIKSPRKLTATPAPVGLD